jgi:phasin family protein
MQQKTQEAVLATPPKPKSRKSGAKNAPAVAKSPVVKVSPKAAVAPKGKLAKAVVKTTVAPVAKPVVAPEASSPVEWPVAAASANPEPVIEVVNATLEPQSNPINDVADAEDSLPVADATTTKGNTVMTDAIETAKTFAEEAKTRIQSAFSEVNEKTKTAMEKSAKAFEELGELTKGNLEAVVESSKIAAKGVEAMSQEAAEMGRKSFEKTSATFKSFASVKTPAEFFQLQSDLMSGLMDSFASETSKNSEKFLKLASDISQPISNRVSVVTEKFKSLAA